MSNTTNVFQSVVVYGLALPLAVFLGYLLANPADPSTFFAVALVLMVLVFPLFLRWHHPWLIASWNMTALLFFLPGRPQLWLLMVGISFTVAVLQYALNREHGFLHVPALTRSLIFLAVVVLVTAKLTGGFGFRAFGSEQVGGKHYIIILGSIIGYFAITSRRIPKERAGLYITLFFLGGATMAIGHLGGMLNPAFNFIFLIFPVETLSAFSTTDVTGPVGALISRSVGLAFLSIACFSVMLAHYGIRGVLDLRKPFRVLAFIVFTLYGTLGGFRSMVVILILTFGVLMYFENLLRGRYLLVLTLSLVLGGGLLAGFANRLPLSVQRSLAFLPIPLDPVVELDAQGSSEWRIQIWKEVSVDIPKYLLLGKGFLFSETEGNFLRLDRSAEGGIRSTELAGDYHNGPLSLILPLGIFGVLAFGWFLVAAVKLLYQNYQFGDPDYHRYNTFLLAYFVAKIAFFLTVFGGFYSDLPMFTGMVAMSVSLNGGIARPVTAPTPQFVFKRSRLHPGATRPIGA
jgi:hypothetical protein